MPIALFVTLRAFKPGIFQELREKRISIAKVLEWLMQIRDKSLLRYTEAFLMFAFFTEEEYVDNLRALADQMNNKASEEAVRTRASRTNDCLRDMSSRFNRRAFPGIVAELEMTNQFR